MLNRARRVIGEPVADCRHPAHLRRLCVYVKKIFTETYIQRFYVYLAEKAKVRGEEVGEKTGKWGYTTGAYQRFVSCIAKGRANCGKVTWHER